MCVGSCNGDYNLNEILIKTEEETYKYLNVNQQNELGEVNYKSDNVQHGKHENVWITSKNSISRTKMFVDFQNDVTAKDIKLALKAVSYTHLTLPTTHDV